MSLCVSTPWESARSPQTESAGSGLCSYSSAHSSPPPAPSGGSELCAQPHADSAQSPVETARPRVLQGLVDLNLGASILVNLMIMPSTTKRMKRIEYFFALLKWFAYLQDVCLTALHAWDELGEDGHGSICLAFSRSLKERPTTREKRLPYSQSALLLCVYWCTTRVTCMSFKDSCISSTFFSLPLRRSLSSVSEIPNWDLRRQTKTLIITMETDTQATFGMTDVQLPYVTNNHF